MLYFHLKMHQNVFGGPMGSLQHSPRPHSWIKGEVEEGEEGRRGGRKGEGPPMSDEVRWRPCRLAVASGDSRETSFLWQRISILIQHFNAIFIRKLFFTRTKHQTSSHSKRLF